MINSDPVLSRDCEDHNNHFQEMLNNWKLNQENQMRIQQEEEAEANKENTLKRASSVEHMDTTATISEPPIVKTSSAAIQVPKPPQQRPKSPRCGSSHHHVASLDNITEQQNDKENNNNVKSSKKVSIIQQPTVVIPHMDNATKVVPTVRVDQHPAQTDNANSNAVGGQQVFNFNDLKNAMDKVTSTFEEMGPERALAEVMY